MNQNGFGDVAEPSMLSGKNSKPLSAAASLDVIRSDVVRAFEHSIKPNAPPDMTIKLKQLLVDPRLESVWKELLRRHRATHPQADTFVYPARLPDILPAGSKKRQALAILSLFDRAACLAHLRLRVVTKREAEAIRREHAGREKLFSKDNVLPFRSNVTTVTNRPGADANDLVKVFKRMTYRAIQIQEMLSRYESGYRRIEELVLNGMALIVDRDTGDPEARYFAIMLCSRAREIFGSPLYASVAKIASVVLERKITTGAVKEWCRGGSGINVPN